MWLLGLRVQVIMTYFCLYSTMTASIYSNMLFFGSLWICHAKNLQEIGVDSSGKGHVNNSKIRIRLSNLSFFSILFYSMQRTERAMGPCLVYPRQGTPVSLATRCELRSVLRGEEGCCEIEKVLEWLCCVCYSLYTSLSWPSIGCKRVEHTRTYYCTH